MGNIGDVLMKKEMDNSYKDYRKRNFFTEKIRPKIFPILVYILLVASCLGIIILLCWAFLSSFKDPMQWYISTWKLPEVWTFKNYITASSKLTIQINSYTRVGFWGLAWNTFLYAGVNAFLCVFTAALTTYILARYKGVIPMVGALWTVYLFRRFIPVGASIGAQLRFFKVIGIYDNMVGQWIMNAGPYGANFLVMYATWRGFGKTYAEAAEIDGANEFQIFIHIMLPLMIGLVLYTFVQKFIGMYNEWMGPMIYLPSYPTLSYGLFRMQYSVEPGMSFTPARLAGLFIMSIIPFIGFMFCRKTMLEGVSIGSGLKG